MPTPLKPCDGKLTDEIQDAIRRNRNREQWGSHLCATCGRRVGIEHVMGKWVPERHWPSVSYPARKAAAGGVRQAAVSELTQDTRLRDAS
jgi:hypothetical protein